MEYSQLIRERYSVRKLSDRPIEDGKVDAILEAARVSPTAVNKQPYRILVLRKREDMEKLAACTPYTFEAPMALVVFGKADEAWVRPYDGYNSHVVDASIIGAQIMLAVHDLGLGTTWVGHFDPAKLREIFQVPAELEPVVVFPIGYPAPDAKPAAMHGKRRPLGEVVVYDGF